MCRVPLDGPQPEDEKRARGQNGKIKSPIVCPYKDEFQSDTRLPGG
jgi:hypothetical protein